MTGSDGIRSGDAVGGPAGGHVWRRPPAIDLGALIGREPYELDAGPIRPLVEGRRVAVTGAGGSIGSHLAQVLAALGPAELVLIDRSENALFEIDRRMGRLFPDLARRAVLHDIVDAEATARLMGRLLPEVVLHAAAHKHVPLMEDHPSHAVRNNVFGTANVVRSSLEAGAGRVVLISTDKAVRPSSVMGASKRLAERVVHRLAGEYPQAGLSMVRFGNVLGSSCSVLTIWSAQIAEGGPVTVTDPRMTRFFMTIPEAATLVVQSMGLCREVAPAGVAPVFVLDMGEPIGVLDLAVRFIEAHGLCALVEGRVGGSIGGADGGVGVGEVVDVVFTGIRPGEKLHEELVHDVSGLRSTSHPGIRVSPSVGLPAYGGHSHGGIEEGVLEELERACGSDHPGDVLAALRRWVPEFGGGSGVGGGVGGVGEGGQAGGSLGGGGVRDGEAGPMGKPGSSKPMRRSAAGVA